MIWLTGSMDSFACGSATSFTEVDLGSVLASCDVEALIYANLNSAGTSLFRIASGTSDLNQGSHTFGSTSYREYIGWFPIVAGTTYNRAIDYKRATGGTLTGYVYGIKMNLRN